MTTLTATENKNQLLPDRLVDEFKSIRERDLDYASTVDWLRRQDVIQLNNGLKKGSKAVKLVRNTNKDSIKDTEDGEPVKVQVPRVRDGDGNQIIPHLQCHNCQNYGHAAGRCKADFCMRCRKPEPGHKWTRCSRGDQGKDRMPRQEPENKSSKRNRSYEL